VLIVDEIAGVFCQSSSYRVIVKQPMLYSHVSETQTQYKNAFHDPYA